MAEPEQEPEKGDSMVLATDSRGCPRTSRERLKFRLPVLLVVLVMAVTGCRTTRPVTGLPAKYSLENEHLVVQSDIKLSRNHELLKDLDRLRDEILTLLDLPEQKQPVVIYLFGDEARYANYLHTHYPRLPPRRAYFVGTSRELAVYTYWGERIQEDLRHEFTHGVLHATLKDVPLWLDEGLAEYFEVTSQPAGLNREYAMNIAAEIASGWKPNLDRLETLEGVEQLDRNDYQESWAWVHFMLQHSEDSREVLVNYLKELRTTSQPGALSVRLRNAIPVADRRFLSHAASLTDGVVRVGRVEPQ
ncbi:MULTISPECIES: DUF1570 domain-containing protein [unclassified Schlesneria]|uniref:DUF1570 domain-containing protein n=1 Tax=Schlesneria TaxID=656899 RepID=UPI002EF870BA